MAEVWPFIPSKITAKLSWKTDVMESIATEQRVKRRLLYPRLELTIISRIWEDEIFQARSLIEEADNLLDVPDYRYPVPCAGPFDSSTLALTFDTTNLHVADTERAVAVSNDNRAHVFTVSSKQGGGLTADTGPVLAMENFHVYPVWAAQLLSPVSFRQVAARVVEVRLNVVITAYKDLTSRGPSLPTYLTYKVATFRDVRIRSVSREIHRVTSKIDSGTGLISLEQSFDHLDGADSMSHTTNDVAETLEREGWFHSLSGRLTPFWRIGWRPDFILTAAASSTDTEIVVTAQRPGSSYTGKHLAILKGSSLSYHEITAAIVAAGEATLTLSPALSFDIAPETVDVISEMNLVRLGNDEVSLNVKSDLITTATVSTVIQDNELT